MARRSNSSGQAVSLFPFLAVLVCVMGALIFLLLATTRRLRDIALAEAEAERQEARPSVIESPLSNEVSEEQEIPSSDLGTPTQEMAEAIPAELPDMAAIEERAQREQEWRDRLNSLAAERDRLAESLRQQQQRNQASRGTLRELEEAVGNAETRLRGLLARVDEFSSKDQSDSDLAPLEAEIITLRTQLRSLQNRPATGKTRFSVIPFDVRSGTTRRPILIECTDSSLRFLSEDVVIRPSDLQGFTEKYNPLLAGAGALVNYWSWRNQQQQHPEEEPEPYVLLIVRPSGTVAYYVALRMLSSLKQPFGYELIDDGVMLEPPPCDPLAKRACEEAVARLLAERSEIIAQAREGFRAGRRAGSTRDTFEVADVVSPSPAVGERSWENIERFEGKPKSLREGNNANSAPNQQVSPPRKTSVSPSSDTTREVARTKSKSTFPSPPSNHELDHVPSSRTAPHFQQQPPPGQKSIAAPPAVEDRLEQLARRRWGKSDAKASIGIEQDVTIRIDSQQVVVADDRVLRVAAGEPPLDLFLRMMEAVDAEAQTWGKPRPGFYWTPRLRFIISPGGNQIFERIDPLTTRSGLSATREFTLEGIRPVVEEIAP